MPDIYHISNATGVSLRTLRKLDKRGFLKAERISNPDLAKIEHTIRAGNPLSASQLFQLWKNPPWLSQLGTKQAFAELAVMELEDVAGEAMPWDISSQLMDAALGKPDAVGACARWLRQSIEASGAYAEGKPYAYVAVRMLADIPDNLVSINAMALPKAVMNIRKHKAMDGYSFVGADKRTIFQKPLDL